MKQTKVLVCRTCEGFGELENEKCTECNGTGKVIRTTEFKPFKEEENVNKSE